MALSSGVRWSRQSGLSWCERSDCVERNDCERSDAGQAVDRKEVQGCKCQKGRNWGVYTHHDFGGAERQSIFYTNLGGGEGK